MSAYYKNIIISLLICLGGHTFLFAQNNQLKQFDTNTKNNYAIVDIEKNLKKAQEYFNDYNYKRALFYAQIALDIAEKFKKYKFACKSLYILAEIYYNIYDEQNESKTYKKGLKYAKLIGDNEQIYLFNSLLGKYYFTKEAYQTAIKYYLECLKYIDAEKNKKDLSWLYNELGVAYFRLSNYEKALEYYFKTLTLKEELNDNFGIANTLLNIGTVYYELNNYQKALENLKKSLKIAEKGKFIKIQSSILNNIGNIYSTISDYDNAIQYLKKALKIKKELKNEKEIAGTYNNIGIAYEDKGEYKIAKSYYQNALEKYVKLKDPDGTATTYRNLGNVEIKLNDLGKAKEFLQTALAIADSNNLALVKQNVYFSYAILYSNQGNQQESDKYYNMHLRLRDSLVNTEFRNRIAQLQILYDVEKKDREYRLLKLENEAKENAIKQQRLILVFMSIIFIMLIVTAVALYKMYQTRKKYNIELEKKNQLLKESEEKLQKINATKDRFFAIISHDLRNPFASMSLIVDSLKFSIDLFEKEKMLEIVSSLEETVNGTQELLMNLLEWSRSQTKTIEFKPQDLDISKLIETSLPLLKSNAATKNIEIYSTLKPNTIVHADANMLNTIIRNLVSNAIKFTPRGGNINIFVSTGNGVVETSVVDSGVGIPPDAVGKLFKIDEKVKTKGTEDEPGTGLGLILCQEFIEKHQGRIEASSELNKGSKFSFFLPEVNNADEKK